MLAKNTTPLTSQHRLQRGNKVTLPNSQHRLRCSHNATPPNRQHRLWHSHSGSLPETRGSIAIVTTLQVAYFAPSTMIGMTLSTSFVHLLQDSLIVPFSVRTKLRNAAPGFSFASNFFLWCLYLKKEGDPAFPEVSFLQGHLLVRIHFPPHIHTVHLIIALFQTYQHIFTSPSSASDENSESEPTSRQCNMAMMLCMDCHVTGQVIAYTATQVSRPLQTYSMYFANIFFQSLSLHWAVYQGGPGRSAMPVMDCLLLPNLLFPFRILFWAAFSIDYLIYLWDILTFSRDFHEVP